MPILTQRGLDCVFPKGRRPWGRHTPLSPRGKHTYSLSRTLEIWCTLLPVNKHRWIHTFEVQMCSTGGYILLNYKKSGSAGGYTLLKYKYFAFEWIHKNFHLLKANEKLALLRVIEYTTTSHSHVYPNKLWQTQFTCTVLTRHLLVLFAHVILTSHFSTPKGGWCQMILSSLCFNLDTTQRKGWSLDKSTGELNKNKSAGGFIANCDKSWSKEAWQEEYSFNHNVTICC